jgi:hypothetical protein
MKTFIPRFVLCIYFPSLITILKYFLYSDPKVLDQYYYYYENTKELLASYTRRKLRQQNCENTEIIYRTALLKRLPLSLFIVKESGRN